MDDRAVVIDTTTLTEIIQNLSEKLKAHYVFPDVAEDIYIRLQGHLADGEYNDITDGELLALALTTHMQAVNQDKHLGVKWYPEPLPDHAGSLLQNPERVDEWKHRARLDNYGVHKVERLAGNVGYIDVRYFYRTSWGSGDTMVAAMNFLANMHAVIVDLRQCRGGNPGTVAMVSSYFFAEEPVHLNSFYWRDDDLTEQYWTLPHVPGKRLADTPIYVLTSKDTFSGGEEFAYNLQTRQRATLVGETTGGGAHPGSPYRIHPHFEVFIPRGRAINPITNQNWEGCGVDPDVSVTQEQALKVAYRLALESVVASLRQPASRPFRLLLEEASAALEDTENVKM